MLTIENNIRRVKARITTACKEAQRSNNSVNLLAVSKTRDINTINLAFQAGLKEFGENYVNEAIEKIPQLPDEIIWHFIGPIQSNKTRDIAKYFDWVETIDREKIIRRLQEQRPDDLEPLNCLIQVNISQEEQKAGAAIEEVSQLAETITGCDKLKLRGLMAIPKAGQPEAALKNDFGKMHELLRELQKTYPSCDVLSMGMSADLELAILEGSTQVRIGTDLFGPRK